MPESDKTPADPLSKSQRKRDMLALQEIGKTLTELPLSQLAKIELPQDLLEAIQFSHTLKTHESKRRHLQYIGKKMRHVDVEAILVALNKIQMTKKQSTDEFHAVEEWRDKLIAKGDEALQLLLIHYPEVDRQHLRQLVRNAQHDLAMGKNTGAATELFRYLRELVK